MSDLDDDSSRRVGFARRPHHARDRALSALVALQVFGIFFALPLGSRIHLPPITSAVVTTTIALVVFSLVHRERWAVVLLLIAATAEAAAVLLRLVHPSDATFELDFFASAIFTIATSGLLGGVVFGPGRITMHRVAGAIAIYLNVGFVFALAYDLVAMFVAHAFRGIADGAVPRLPQFVYFSYGALSTSGFGDIVPLDALARSLANLETIIGQLFPATLLARIVMLEIAANRNVE